jgi:hypothetical protein
MAVMIFVTLAIGTDCWSAVAPRSPTPWTNTADWPAGGNGKAGGVPGKIVGFATSETRDGRKSGRGTDVPSTGGVTGFGGPAPRGIARERQADNGNEQHHGHGSPAPQLAAALCLARREMLGAIDP